jgi:membrane protease YdiL (CAAX protease family)
MYTIDRKPDDKKSNSTMWHILMLLCTMCIGIVIGQITIQFLLTSRSAQLASSPEAYKQFLLTSQAIMGCSIFIVGPLLYWYQFEKKPLRHLFAGEQRYMAFIIHTFALMFVAMTVNTFFTSFNMQLKFPTWLAGFEKWAQEKEAALKQLTDLLTTFHSLKDFLIVTLVIGVIPAIGEEFVFRGILQKIFFRGTHNMHIAIVISALIFSAIHLQFYGFLPRFFLGVLFGYLYWWTQNLAFPIAAHFFNNFATLIVLFLHQRYPGKEEHESVSIIWVLFCALAVAVFIHELYKRTRYLHNNATNS